MTPTETQQSFPWKSLDLQEFVTSDNATLHYLFCGEKSVVPYQSVCYQKRFYTDSRIHVFEGLQSSHFAWMENHKEFNALINDFL